MNVSKIKKLYLFIIIIFSLHANSQQSLGYSLRPEGISIGSVGKSTNSQIIISDVPVYQWYRGCGPTALGMVVGYYDSQGFADLVSGDAASQTTEVNDMMASEGHYNDYSLPKDYYPDMVQDNSELGGAHTANSVADYMQTSWSSRNNYWGWSWSSDMGPAFVDYATQQNENYSVSSSSIYYNSDSWNYLKVEIDNNRPVVLLVDSSGNGSTDHFVTGIGYDESTHQYAIYDTWDNAIHWYEYRPMSSSYSWGVYNFTTYTIENSLLVGDVNNTISIYPNPTKDVFFIKNEFLSTTFKVEVFDAMGKLLLATADTRIDLSNYNSGIYNIKITDKEHVYFYRILKK